MTEAAVGTIIQVVLDNLFKISQEQISLVRHFKDDLETLKETFSMVQDFLHDAEEKQVKESAVKRWLRDLEALAFDADNVLDEIDYQLLSKKVGATRNKSAKKKVQSFFSNNPIAYRLKMGSTIREINEKLKSINQQAIGFGLQTIVARAPDASVSMETDSFSEDPVTLGRENDVSRIVEMLITTSPADRKLSVLPIVGMGGLGKTTLARLVFGHANIKTRFETHVWVHVPRNFDVLVLLKKIFTSMTTENVEHGNREALLKKLQNNLGAKKYLLVLDDVWNEDREKWDDFVKSFSGISSSTGNCMIVTTRSEVVASIVETLPVHKLKGLSDDDCWSIIKAKAFRGGDNPLEFETIGRNIAIRCKGLPLAAKVFGGLLFGKSKDEWLGFEKKPLSYFGDGDYVYKILKLSFDNLSSPSLKKCFAYCSIFPKGDVIEKEEMIQLWMAEGFLQIDLQRSNLNLEAIGSKFVNILLQNSLLQVVRRDYDYGNVTHYNLHDLVHDVACSIFGENDNVTYGTSQRYVRRLDFNIGKASDFRFSDFQSLHILTLWGRDTDDLPTSIRELKHLRYLDISKTKIRCLPESIGELYHLQTFRAQKPGWHSYLEKLPDSLSNLISLRHLHIPDRTTLPPHIGKLTSLQTLSYFNVGDEKGFGISELGNLKDLKGRLEIHNLEKVSDKNEAMSADLLGKPGIYELRLMWGSREGHEANEGSVLEGLQPHPNLKSLYICGFNGKNLPQWTSKMAVQLDVHCWEGLDNLMEITLRFCSEFEELPMLGHLPHLKSLHLRDLTNVRFIASSFYGVGSCKKSSTISTNGVGTIDVFRALETLELRRLPSLTEWAEVGLWQQSEVRVFPCLKYLTIIACTQLIRVPSHFPCLERLNIGFMESRLPLENICETETTSLTLLEIHKIQGLKCLPDGLFSNNHNLMELAIHDCPDMTHLIPCLRGGGALLTNLLIEDCLSLRELPDDLPSLNALEKFEISNCPDLKSIPGQQQGFTSLRELRIRNCGELTNLPFEMVESLEELGLYGLSSTINIPKVIGRMRCLTSLAIVEVPEYRIRKTSNLSINSSQRLVIGLLLDSSWNNISFSETVDAMLLQCISLRGLELRGMEHLECLPDQLQHLTSLEELWLSGFGIEALPEWFGNLSSLKSLIINNFKKLRHLPSKQAMLRLSKLTFLSIRGCPLLLKEKSSNTDNANNERSKIIDSECPKISHITTISVG